MALALIFEILTVLIIGLVIYLTAKLIVSAYLTDGERKRSDARKAAYDQALLPLKLQAGERMILLLERMTPPQAVYRTMQPGMTVLELQMSLVRHIREEFEHNVAQQIYLSPACWTIIRTAKEEVIRMVNMAASEADVGANAGELGRLLLEHWGQLHENPVQSAIDRVKAEIRETG